MTHYTYTFLTLRDEQVVEEISLFGVFAQRMLNGAGQFNGSFSLDQTGKNNDDLINATTPGKTWLVMERISNDGVATPVWWGFVWSRTYQSQAKICELFAFGFENYPTKQIILSDINITGGQMSVFSQLWAHMQASAAGRNININVPTSLPSESIVKTASVLATDYKYYNSIMDALANASDGFDWTVQLTKQPNNVYRKDLILQTPTIGQPNNGAINFEYPGTILNYYRTDSMADAGTDIYLFGKGEGSTQLVSTFEWNGLIGSGFPRWDIEVNVKDIDNQAQLDGLAEQEAIKRKAPMPMFTLTIKSDRDPVFGSWSLGDGCSLIITDSMHPDGVVIDTRIVGFELHPQSADGSEEVKLLLPGDATNA